MTKAQPLSFHACPPSGEWYNDPNGLFFDGQTFQLFAQHRSDAPLFEKTGWARQSTHNLLNWTGHSAVIPAESGDTWSGSIRTSGSTLEAWHTRHYDGQQDQVMRHSEDAGLSWTAPVAEFGPVRTDWRDPFVFRWGKEWRMLVAAPAPWHGSGHSLRSHLTLYQASESHGPWEECGQIGPWNEAGILWEVPFLIPDPVGGDLWSLIISRVDRRNESAWCDVRRWRGHFDGRNFIRLDQKDNHGEAVDCGPDFYAAVANVEEGWPFADRALVGWASNWQTARAFPWPGFHGGPISLPRAMTTKGTAPLREVLRLFSQPTSDVPKAGLGRAEGLSGPVFLRIEGQQGHLDISIASDGALSVERQGADWIRWRQEFPATRPANRALSIFVDGPLLEIHIAADDRWITCALPEGDRPFKMGLQAGEAPASLIWSTLG